MTTQARFGPTSHSLMVEFVAGDVPGVIALGKMASGLYCSSCVIEIENAFDDGVTITVGDMAAQGRFQVATDNVSGSINFYETQPNFAYPSATDVFVFLTGTPTVGRGRAIMYLD